MEKFLNATLFIKGSYYGQDLAYQIYSLAHNWTDINATCEGTSRSFRNFNGSAYNDPTYYPLDDLIHSGTHHLGWKTIDVTEAVRDQYSRANELNIYYESPFAEVPIQWFGRRSSYPPHLVLEFSNS